MLIKQWNNRDYRVYRITPELKKFFSKKIKQNLSKDELKEIKKIAKFLAEEISIVFEDNLKKGWENQLLINGRITTKSNRQLATKEETNRALLLDGEIQFHSYRKNGSCAFIKKLLKPAHLRRS